MAVCFNYFLSIAIFLNIDISQGSVATCLRCGGIFKYELVANLPVSLPVKELWKSVNIWGSYGQEFGVLFFWDTVYIRTYIYPFNGPLSGTTGVSRYHKGKTIWILLKQEALSGSGIVWAICKPAPRSRQITMPAPHHSVFYRPDALPAAQPTASKHWRHGHFTYYYICTNIAVNFLENGNEIAVMSRTEVACVTLQ